jgi:hypothetical protein
MLCIGCVRAMQAVGMPLTIPLSDDAEPEASLQWSLAKGVYADISFKGDISIYTPLLYCADGLAALTRIEPTVSTGCHRRPVAVRD